MAARALPFGNSDFFWVILIALPFSCWSPSPCWSLIGERRAAGWPPTMGRIDALRERGGASYQRCDQVTRLTAVVEYEFTVAGRTWRGNRVVSARAPIPTQPTRRYPVGTIVEGFTILPIRGTASSNAIHGARAPMGDAETGSPPRGPDDTVNVETR